MDKIDLILFPVEQVCDREGLFSERSVRRVQPLFLRQLAPAPKTINERKAGLGSTKKKTILQWYLLRKMALLTSLRCANVIGG